MCADGPFETGAGLAAETLVAFAATTDAPRARGLAVERYGWLEQDARGVWQAPNGARIAWFKDPDGNVLSVAQYRSA